MNSISVIVPCFGWPVTLAACLRSLAMQNVHLPIEVVVVVNGPNPARVPASYPGVRIVYEPVMGPAAARNAGVLASHGNILAFTDADCVADPGWLAAALDALQTDAAACVIAGAITRSGAQRNIISLYDSVTFLRQEAYVKWSHALVTANMVLHRSVFTRVGNFDLAFNEAAFEDWDWSLRAQRAHVELRYVSRAAIDHPCMYSFRQLRSKLDRLARGEIIFRRKYKRRVRQPSVVVLMRAHALRALRASAQAPLKRLQLMAVGMLAGFWRWQAFRRILRAERRRVFHTRGN